jgi:hypothetical protein
VHQGHEHDGAGVVAILSVAWPAAVRGLIHPPVNGWEFLAQDDSINSAVILVFHALK